MTPPWVHGVLATELPRKSPKILLCHTLWKFSHGNSSFLGDFVTLLRTPQLGLGVPCSWVLGCLVILALDEGRSHPFTGTQFKVHSVFNSAVCPVLCQMIPRAWSHPHNSSLRLRNICNPLKRAIFRSRG